MSLSTSWSVSMGLSVPIVNAPMGGVAGGALAAAVSRAGGLGMIGMGSAATADLLEEQLHHVRDLDRPFGIGLVGWVATARPDLLDVALAAHPALLCVSFGEDWSWLDRAREVGVRTATQVGDVAGAENAVRAGVDVIVARGAEGGGHGQPKVGTLPLLSAVLDRVPVPVLAAGGISNGRALAAVLAAGAAGGWLGTAFCACREGLLPDAARRRLLAAADTDTIVSRVFDVTLGYDWPAHLPERVLRNPFADRWSGREEELAENAGAREELVRAAAADDYDIAPVNAGQGVGELVAVRSAGEVVDDLTRDATAALGRWQSP